MKRYRTKAKEMVVQKRGRVVVVTAISVSKQLLPFGVVAKLCVDVDASLLVCTCLFYRTRFKELR